MKRLIFILILALPFPALAANWGNLTLRDVGRGQEGRNWVALEFDLNDGWKTYYKFAGQNGLDPLITATQDGEEIPIEVNWPEPHLFIADDLPSLGYKGEFLVPMSVEADGTVDIAVDIGVCETVCVPISLDFSFNAQPGFSVEQYILQGAPRAPKEEQCEWETDRLAALDPEKYWMFIEDSGWIGHEAPKDFKNGAILELDGDGIRSLSCED